MSKTNQRNVNTVLVMILCLFSTVHLLAQDESKYKVGDRVEADVNMSSSPENASWRKATIVEVMMWQGKISGIHVKTDEGRTFTLAARHLRPSKDAAQNTQSNNSTSTPNQKEDGNSSKFKVGDRVEVDSIMANDAKDASWKKATVKAVDLKSGRYVVMLDDFNEMSVLIRPGKTWIRPLNDGSTAPAYAACEFYKSYKKVSNTAPPSGELFKSVIFEWNQSINKYYDFGLVFEDLRMGKAFKNSARGNGRKDVDPAPLGATIYPLKTKLITCEKDLNSTFRTEWTNEYSCYKSQFGEWVCKNGAPQNYKRVSFPNN